MQLSPKKQNPEIDLGSLSPAAKYRLRWTLLARPDQLTPKGNWLNWLIVSGRGWGKMLSLDTLIPTPEGWSTMGTLSVGDSVFDESGRACKVTWMSPIQVPDKCYRVKFHDGESVDACGDHLWVTWTHAERKAFLRSPYEDTSAFPSEWPGWKLRRMVGQGSALSQEKLEEVAELVGAGLSERSISDKLGVCRFSISKYRKIGFRVPSAIARVYDDSPGPQIRTTEEILETLVFGKREDTNHCIPNCLPLDLPDADVPIQPYTLGVWLGDGSSKDGTITQWEGDQPELISQLERDGLRCVPRANNPQSIGVLRLSPNLRVAGVLNNKHIPDIYFRASISQRLSLLQGLMDTDGGVDGGSTVSFCNGNKLLADGVYELVVGLGMRATRSVRSAESLNKYRSPEEAHANLDSYQVTFTPTMQVFRLRRKADRLFGGEGQKLRKHHRMIVGVDPIDPIPMRCITVNSRHGMYLCGKGMIPTHNTRTGAEDVCSFAMSYPGSRIAVVAPTYADARNVCMEGDSGILSCLPDELTNKGNNWNRSLGELKLTNGSSFHLYTAEQPDRLRGPQHHRAWCDELAAFGDSGGDESYCWDMLKMGLRLGRHPQVVITTTPRPIKLIRELIKDPQTYVTTGSTFDNQANLPESFIKSIISKYANTRIGQQELYAKILEDTPGALWQRNWIDGTRIPDQSPESIASHCSRVVVAIDPATTSGGDSDLTGIVASGIDEKGHGFVLADLTFRGTSNEWASKAIYLYRHFKADAIVAEVNNGGDMIVDAIRMVDPNVPVIKVTATRGKYVRAEPVAILYEQGRVHHVGMLSDLEEEMCMFTVDNIARTSPNRCDALVWSMHELFDLDSNSGALDYLKEEFAPKTSMQIRDDMQKVMSSRFTKPAKPDNMPVCSKCGSNSLRLFGAMTKCMACGAAWIGQPAMVPASTTVRYDFLAKMAH